MSEEDASDSEVMMDTKQAPQPTHSQQLSGRHLRSDVTMIDSQLKALGLYEEGLSYEQKEELLAVVAASRETAEQEASMRLRAQEWQQKVIIDDVDLGAKTAKLSLSSSPPALVDACTSTSKVESSVCSTSSENPSSQNLFESLDSEIESSSYPVNRSSSPEITEIPSTSESDRPDSQDFKSKKPVGRRGRGRRGGASTQSTRPSASHTISSNSIEDMEIETIDEDVIHIDSVRQKRELEKVIPEWQPCGSPDAGSITSDRFSCQEERPAVSQSSSEHAKKLLYSIDEFHAAVDKFQRNSGVYVTWGQPITVGRAYATRSTRTRGAESENSDGILSYNSPDDDSTSRELHSSYLHLRGFDKSVASNNPKSIPSSSKGYKAAALSESPKPSLFPTSSLSKRNNRLSKSQSGKNASSSSLSTVSPNKIPLSLRIGASSDSKTSAADMKENLVSLPKIPVNSCVQDNNLCTENTTPLRDENSQPITRTNMPKDTPLKLFTNQTNNRVYKLTQNHNAVPSNEKRRRFLKAIEDKPIVNQVNYADPGKRKSVSSSIKNFSSPAKRLKSAGTS